MAAPVLTLYFTDPNTGDDVYIYEPQDALSGNDAAANGNFQAIADGLSYLYGSPTFTGDINVGGDVDVTGNLSVAGAANFENDNIQLFVDGYDNTWFQMAAPAGGGGGANLAFTGDGAPQYLISVSAGDASAIQIYDQTNLHPLMMLSTLDGITFNGNNVSLNTSGSVTGGGVLNLSGGSIQSHGGMVGTSGDTLSFFGKSGAVGQQTAPTAVATTTPTTGAYGFTLAQAQAIIAAVNQLITNGHNLGLTT